MAGLDWTNPLPIVLGGGPTDIEGTWLALRSAEGGEHGPGPVGGLEDASRQIQAAAIAGTDRAIERGFLQTFPGLSTDALPLWEIALLSDGADTEVALRALLEALWRTPDGATTPHLAQALLDISAQLSIELEDEDLTIVTCPGKYLAPTDDVPEYGPFPAARLPNYGSRDVLRVVYTLGVGEIAIPENVTRDVTKLLRRRLPSTMTWTLTQVTEGSAVFLLDGGIAGESVLDVTPLG